MKVNAKTTIVPNSSPYHSTVFNIRVLSGSLKAGEKESNLDGFLKVFFSGEATLVGGISGAAETSGVSEALGVSKTAVPSSKGTKFECSIPVKIAKPGPEKLVRRRPLEAGRKTTHSILRCA